MPARAAASFVAEIAWREFYAHVLWHHPRVLREPFQPAFADLPWRDDPEAFEAWRDGPDRLPGGRRRHAPAARDAGSSTTGRG